MKSKCISRLLAIILVGALLMQMLPVQTFAVQESSTDSVSPVETNEPITIVGEEVSLRGEAEKHFRLSDGSYLAVTYDTPVHYMDSLGKWQDINNLPLMSVDAEGKSTYQIANGDKATVFPSVLSDGVLFSTASGNVAVSMHLLDTAQAAEHFRTAEMEEESTASLNTVISAEDLLVYDRTASATLETQAETLGIFEDDKDQLTHDITLENLSSSILYEDVFPGVDLRYETFGYNIKEEIIIHEAQNGYRYDFFLELTGLSALLNDDGSIDLVDSNNISIYQIPAPFMFDATGTMSTDVHYSLMEIPGGAVLTVTASEEWINAEERVFPIIIDPTLNLTIYTSNYGENLSMYLTFVEESVPNENRGGTPQMYIGYGINDLEMIGYFYLNQLPTLPVGAIVTEASLNVYMHTFDGYHVTELPIGLYEVTSGPGEGQSYPDWIRNLTWNTKPTQAEEIIDYEIVSKKTIHSYNYHGPISWDMTELVKKWYIDKTENRTISLSLTSDDYDSTKCGWFAFRAWGDYVSPKLIVNYRNNTGIEPYYTYTTLGAGAAGTAYIADATGQLKIGKQLVGYASSINPFSLNLIYNSDYFLDEANNNYDPLEEMGLSMSISEGWTLDYIQKIGKESISGKTYLKYHDGDGTIHYFAKDSSKSSTYYYDEDGLGLKIKDNGSNSYEMSDDYGNTWKFTNSLLTECADENGNKIIINYSDNRLVSIVQKNENSNSAYAGITVATFSYSEDGRLSAVTDAAGNVFTLCYTDDTNKLTAIKQGGTIIAQYGYVGNRVTRMIDQESCYAIAFSYGSENNNGRIVEFQEQIVDLTGTTPTTSLTGATVAVDYPSYSQTLYRDYGNDRTENSDDILTYYLFDYAGRTANAYTTDASDKILGASNAVYSGSGSTDKTNNRTLRTASIGAASQQLLKNSSFESNTGWNFDNSRVQTNPRTGQYAMSLSQDVSSETVNLSANQTYTFSAYVDTSSVTAFAGQGIYLKVACGEQDWTGTPMSYQTSADNKWTRISVTFTTQTGGAYTLYICNDGVSGAVYVDDLQLEEGEAPSNYNLLENGSLSLGNYGWTTSTAAQITNGVIQIAGSPTDDTANASQSVQINLPSTETYVLSGWVEANAVPDTVNTAADPAQDTNKQCGLRAAIHYTDETVEYHYVPFNTDLSTKQFVSYTIVPNPKDANGNPVVKIVDYIVVTCAYETNANTASFDDISLVREVTQTMEYDEDGNLKSVTTSGLNVDINTYEGGNLIKTVTGSQGVFEYEYHDTYTHRLMSVTNQNTENSPTEWITQSMVYDDYGNVISTTLSGPGNLTMSTSAEYTNSGNLLSTVTDATGATVTYGYEEITHNGNVLTTAEYSRMMGLPTAISAPNGTTTYTAYDLYGRVTQTSVADLATLLYNYSKGNLHEITRSYIKDGQEKTQTYTLDYDPFGKTSSISVGNRQLASYDYLAGNGLLSKQTYSNGHEVSFTYDNLGRTKTVTHKDGPTLSYAYTGDGQLHSVTETNGSNSTVYLYRYDSLGNLVGSEKLINNSLVLRTHHSYDTDNRLSAQGWQIGSTSFSQTYNYGEWDGNLSSMTFSQDSETLFSMTYGYDGLRRLISTNNGLFGRNYAYNSNGNQTTSQVSSLTYTGPACSFAYGYTYDSMGNIETYSDGNSTITYEYDAQGQLLGADVNGDQVNDYVYTYDAVGNILTANGHEYTYDNADWIDLLTKYDGQQITYDSIGNPLSYYNGTRWEFTWTQGRQLQQAFTTSDTQDLTIEYTYDADGLRTGKTVSTKTYSEHECDYTVTVVSPTCVEGGYTLHECSCGESYQDAETPALGHDFVTTVVDPTGTTPGYTQYTCTRCGYTYSNHTHSYTAGQVIAPTCTQRGYTIYQCLCGAKDERNFVNALGHDYTNSFGSPSQTCKRCGHKRGDIDLPITPIVPPGGGIIMGEDTGSAEIMSVYADENRTLESTVVTEYEYIYAGTKLVRMIVTTTVDDGMPTVQTLDFAYDASGMPVTVTTDGDTYYYITNLQGDVMALVDSTGTTVAEYSYDPYGGVIDATGDLAEINPLTYRGYVYDTETTLYYLQSRYYDPEMGRFINADSLASTGQGILGNNMFAYCNNNTVNSSDYFGCSPHPCMIALNDAGSCITTIEIWIRDGVAILERLGIPTDKVGAFLLGMYESDSGIYHARTDCMQRIFGYNSLYDWAFEIGTCMDTRQFPFTHDGNSYIIWAWKGDYINLGAGAEMGIYYGTGPHYFASLSLSMPMSMNLSYKGQSIITHSQNTWWITGFNSNYTNVHAYQLTASFTIDFSSNPAMFNSFYSTYAGAPGWVFNSTSYSASYSF